MECDDNSNETTACTVAPATESAPQPLTEQVAARKFDSPPTAMNAADIASAAMQVAPSNNGAVAAATFKKENLVLESEANGYKYYKIADTMFSEDAAGNWFKLNTSRNEFEAYIWPDEIKKRQAQKKEYPYVDVDKFGRATFPVNEHGEPILPKNEAGAKVFPIDNDGKPIFPWDWANDRPTLPVNDKRRPVFPIGSHGKPIVPMDIHGYPIFPLNPDDGNYLFPEREDGRPIPPVNIFDVPVLPLDEHGNHVVPYDSKGEPLIKLGGQDGLTPMTLEEYGEWEEQCRQWMLYQQQYNPEYYQQMYGDNQALPGTPAYYAQQLRYQPENPVDQAARLEREKAEKAKKLLEWQLKSRVRKEEDKKDSDENEDKDDGSKRVIPTPTMVSKPAFAKLKEQEREMRKNKEMKEKELQQQKTEVARKEDVHVQKKKSRSRSRSPVTSEKTGGAVRRVYVGGKLQQVTPVSSREGTPEFSVIRRGERDRSDSRSESRARRSDKKKGSKREKERRERDKKKTRSSKKRRRSRSQSSRSPSNSSRESRSRRVSKQSRRVADARARSESQELSAEELERRAREAALEALANAKKKQQKQTQEKTSAKPAPADDTEEYTVALPPHLVPSPPLEETQKHPEPEPEQPQPVVDVVQHEQTVDQPADKQDTEEEMMECQQQQSRDDGYDSEGERIMLELRERRRRKEEAELAMLEQLSQMHSQPPPASAPQETAEVEESVSSVPDSRVESSLIGGGGEEDMEQCATPEPTVEELEQKVEAMKEQMAREEERERAEAEQASRATTTSLPDQQQADDDGFELRKSDRALAAAPVAPADEKEDTRPAVAAFLPRKVVTAEKRDRRRVESSSSPSDTDKQLEEESLSGMALLSALRKERALMEEERERSERVLSELRETRKRRAEAGGDEPVRQRPAGELIGQLQHLVDGNDKAQALLQQLMRTMNQKTNGF